jgi:CheY-like chemotaxis protein
MNKKILWIEDDIYHIEGLIRPLEREGFTIEKATSAYEGYLKVQKWEEFDIILVDLILPLASGGSDVVPDLVKQWTQEPYPGIGMVKWLLGDLKVSCPVIILSVVANPIVEYDLEEYWNLENLPKRGLLPSVVKSRIYEVLSI